MLFRKRHVRGGAYHPRASEAGDALEDVELIRIDFEMMKKGTVLHRRGKPIRQCGVTVSGSTRLVTSGDSVDRKTYEALVAAGVIAPLPAYGGAPPKKAVSLSDEEVSGAGHVTGD
ncbi:MAG: hypothetical protein HZB26_22385 [Candidatus Hydrogenedentes bacterium]|nr:hypothetical protein [Candidatus Hydrogenedentota bacterium]